VHKAKTLLIIVFILSIASVSNAENIVYVDVNGPNDPGTGTFDDPFRKIQDAIDDANGGDIIEIRPGLYSGDGNYDLDPNGKSITIRSTEPNDPNIVANTIIDPNGAGRGFYFHSGEDANCIVFGLTITNGNVLDRGGGIYCQDSSPTISNCVISENSAGLFGGGVQCDASSSKIMGCTISGNSAQDGGGVGYWLSESPRLTNCIISDNQASDISGGGGGLEFVVCNNTKLTNCTLAGNTTAGSGGAVRCEESEVTIKNCIIVGNNADANGPQIALESFTSNPSTASISFTNLEGGQLAAYVDPCSVLVWGSGNQESIDPCFVSFEPNGNSGLWDFHLQSAYGRWEPNSQSWVTDSNTSPCIDAGDPNSDWSDEPWPNGKRINMGCYGGTNQASMNGNIADFNISGSVDLRDFAAFSDKWFIQEFCIEDLTNNGVVDFTDLGMFVKNWLWQKE
jgi:hypothetical protein